MFYNVTCTSEVDYLKNENPRIGVTSKYMVFYTPGSVSVPLVFELPLCNMLESILKIWLPYNGLEGRMDRSGNVPSPRSNFQRTHTVDEPCPTFESNARIVRSHVEDVDGQSGEDAVNTRYLSASDLKAQDISEGAYTIPGHLESSS